VIEDMNGNYFRIYEKELLLVTKRFQTESKPEEPKANITKLTTSTRTTKMKTISVPLSEDAMHRLDLNECLPSDLEELFLSEEEFSELSKTGVIEEINKTLSKLIDVYEDDKIQGRAELESTLKIFQKYLITTNSDTLRKLTHLNEIAMKYNTGMFFYF